MNVYLSKTYCVIIDNWLYTGKTKQSVKETIDLKEAWLEEDHKSNTKFKVITDNKKLKLKAKN